ncbi:hypothetical protein NP233_g11298 [Leucocoprinus birnbaumii]|uniref:DUF6534 domain-containing protein n=1 Tax=Leucocoprinus birnbaumii TaxID=56174 RepID=A0AAD5VGP2_9AGAR|nr:hypothetical protein NP233_g11298 [Leucocoprinus birnbaumii]
MSQFKKVVIAWLDDRAFSQQQCPWSYTFITDALQTWAHWGNPLSLGTKNTAQELIMLGGPAELAYGPVFIGLVFNILLFGVMIAQCYIYYTTYKNQIVSDRAWIRIFITVILVLDIFNTVLYTYFVYDGVITHFGDVAYIERVTWYLLAATIAMGVIQIAVQAFYAWRIHVLIQNWFLTLFVLALSLAGGACSWITVHNAAMTPIYTEFQSWEAIVMIWLGCACAADIVITHSQKTGFRRSDMIVDRIIRVTVQTGLITSIVAIANIAIFVSDATGTHLIFNVMLSKLYSNSLLSSLNSRGGWKFNQLSTTPSSSPQAATDISTFQAENTPSFLSVSPRGPNSGASPSSKARGLLKGLAFKRGADHLQPEVFVHVESHEMQDAMPTARGRPSGIAKDIEAEGDSSSLEENFNTRYASKNKSDI